LTKSETALKKQVDLLSKQHKGMEASVGSLTMQIEKDAMDLSTSRMRETEGKKEIA
jgi:hypothetical protein